MFPPISIKVVNSPVRAGFIPTFLRVISDLGVISAATIRNAADDGSAGTAISRAVSSA